MRDGFARSWFRGAGSTSILKLKVESIRLAQTVRIRRVASRQARSDFHVFFCFFFYFSSPFAAANISTLVTRCRTNETVIFLRPRSVMPARTRKRANVKFFQFTDKMMERRCQRRSKWMPVELEMRRPKKNFQSRTVSRRKLFFHVDLEFFSRVFSVKKRGAEFARYTRVG